MYGRKFPLITDHKPLVTLLGPKSSIPPLAAARLQRWALLLASHSYDIQYKRTQDHSNADSLSRLPLQSQPSAMDGTFTVGQIQALPTTVDHIVKETQYDTVLRKVYQYVVQGWPEEETPDELQPFRRRKNELSTEGSCLLWGSRVIVPHKLRQPLLTELHRGHPGITRMKAIARSYMWWPGLNQNIEDLVKNCIPCQTSRHNPAEAPLHPWIWPSQPWQRVHMDFAGPFLNQMFLIVVDAHSKWPKVIQMSSTTANSTIRVLRHLFARYGLPVQVVTDNGPQFTAAEFSQFLKCQGIKHIKSSPYHPSTNGLAERFVQTFKAAMHSGAGDVSDAQQRLTEFLLVYRSTPHATTARSPCELFLRRSVRTKLSLIQPSCYPKVLHKQARQQKDHDKKAANRVINLKQRVMARNYRHGDRWLPGVVIQKYGPLTYSVQLDSGQVWRRHLDQLRAIGDDKQNTVPEEPLLPLPSLNTQVPDTPLPDTPPPDTQPSVIPTQEPRYPVRNRRNTDRYTPPP